MRLYDLTTEYQQLIDMAATATDEADQQAFADTLEGLAGEIAEKIESCAAVFQTIIAEAHAVANEEERLAARRRCLLSTADKLKSYMQHHMELAGIEKVKGQLFTVAIQANPAKVMIEDEASLPPEFMRIKQEPNLTSIRSILKDGGSVPGCRLEQSKGLRIR